MSLSVSTYTLGPLQNNCYLVYDPTSRESVVIDPPLGAKIITTEIEEKRLSLKGVWLTHAHFDHMSGIADLVEIIGHSVSIGLHKAELTLYKNSGYAKLFGLSIPDQPEPALFFEHGQILTIGSHQVEVRHCPGHSNGGQVIYYAPDAAVAFCGDVIFRGSIGRTDLPNGDQMTLLTSIKTHILTLPPETQLLSGHGETTTVGEEKINNPFLQNL